MSRNGPRIASLVRKAYRNSNWLEYLLLVLHGIRSTVKEEIATTPAELVYGTTLSLLGQMITSVAPKDNPDPANYIYRLRGYMSLLPFIALRSQYVTTNYPLNIQQGTQVFVRNDDIRPPFQPPHSGAFKVLCRTPKTRSASTA
uniref:Uncharacterized protein n=1 Tax=Octopus bimaculoides TaxID=37653 RepID=A0A0L8HTP9_OCTBM